MPHFANDLSWLRQLIVKNRANLCQATAWQLQSYLRHCSESRTSYWMGAALLGQIQGPRQCWSFDDHWVFADVRHYLFLCCLRRGNTVPNLDSHFHGVTFRVERGSCPCWYDFQWLGASFQTFHESLPWSFQQLLGPQLKPLLFRRVKDTCAPCIYDAQLTHRFRMSI